MMMRFALLALPLALLASCGDKGANTTATAAAGPVAPVKPPAGTDWLTTVSATPDGGFRMGNPNAPIKLVEYGSLSCSHCAEFSKVGYGPLTTKYVATGKVSYEFRNYIRDPMDVTASLLARCGGAGPFFPLAEQMYADQGNWFAKVQAMGQDEGQKIASLPPAQQFTRFAEITGMSEFVKQRGLGEDQAKACLADSKAVDKLLAMQKRANDEYSLQGTPTFLINGRTVPDTATWEALEPKLKAAGA